MNKTQTTARQFRTKIENLFRKTNPTAEIEWTFTGRPFVGKGDGRLWRCGQFVATAEDYRTRTMSASMCITTGELEVR